MTLDIIIPIRNGAHKATNLVATLQRDLPKLDGVRAVFVDDASTDETPEVLDRIVRASDGRMRLVRLETNRCIGGARNAGVATSDADYVAFADADDDFATGGIEAIVTALADKPDLVIYGFTSVRAEVSKDWMPYEDEKMWTVAPVAAWIKAVRRDVFVPFRENVFCEDCSWWFPQADRIDPSRVTLIRKAVYIHDRRDGGFSDAMSFLGSAPATLETLAYDNTLLKRGMNDRAPSDVLRCLADMYDVRNGLKRPEVYAAWRMRFSSIYQNIMTGRWVY